MKRCLLVFIVSMIGLFPAYRPVDAGVNEDLLKAAEEGKVEEVKRLLGAGADINARGANKLTPLILSILKNKTDVAKFLIGKGADINARNEYGYTALCGAAAVNSIDVAGILLAKGMDLNDECGGMTPLLLAALWGQREMVDFLVSKGADVKPGNKENQLTPLHHAAMLGDERGAASLIDNGADVDKEANFWGTRVAPLFFAIRLGRGNMVKLLAGKGASLNNPSFWGFPVYIAAEFGRVEIADLLVSRGADLNRVDTNGETVLERAIKRRDDRAAEYFIAKGTNIHLKLKKSGSFLGLASKNGCAKVVGVLIEKGAPVNVRDESGNTPLMESIGSKQPEIARLLIEKGADVNAKDGSGNTPLRKAMIWEQPEIARLLIEKGADANVKEVPFGRTLLHLAAEKGLEEEARILLEKGLDPLAKDSLERTPVSEAVNYGHASVLKVFIEKGLNVDTKNKYEETLLHLAVEKRKTAVVSLLIEKGANVNATTRLGKTPVYVAEEKDFADMADLLRRHGATSKREELNRLARKLTEHCDSVSFYEDDVKVAIKIARSLSPPPVIPEEARRSFAEGLAAFELARAPSDYEEPEKKFRKAACLAPWWPDVFFNLSLVDEKLRKYDTAKYKLEIYLLAAPDGRDADAVRQKIHKINYLRERQTEAEGHITRGAELFNGKNYKEAVEENKEAVRLDPDCALAHANLGGAYIKLDRTQEGIVELKEGIRLGVDRAYVYSNLAFAYRKLGDTAKAINVLEEYSRKHPFSTGIGEVHLRLARYYDESGQTEKAVQYLQNVSSFGTFEADDNVKLAKEMLARLKGKIGR